MKIEKLKRSEEEWKDILTPEQYEVLRKKGTEKPFSGQYVNATDKGIYRCKACNNELFSSESKFDSGSGWPSFSDVVNAGNVVLKNDESLGMVRTEVLCAKCDSHLGHVFNDGPSSTGKRYCINSTSLGLKK